jgi:DNA-binding transcriptional ArsR family regulator
MDIFATLHASIYLHIIRHVRRRWQTSGRVCRDNKRSRANQAATARTEAPKPCGKPQVTAEHVDIDKVFKALADPGRRRLLDVLHRENGQTLTALCEYMDMTRQAVTQHLQLLEDANLVAIVWQGREKLHYLNPVPLFDIYKRWIGKFERSRLGALRDLKKKLEGDDDD